MDTKLALNKAEGPLEWQVILDALGQRVATPLGRERLRRLDPLPNRQAVVDSLATIEELRQLKREGALPLLGGIEDIREVLVRAEKEGVLLPLELVSIGRTLEALSGIYSAFADLATTSPLSYAIVAEIDDYLPLARAIANTFDPAGNIVDDASADLRELRRRVGRLRDDAKSRLGDLVNRLGQQELLQESYYTLRGDRYVVPVRTDRRGEVQGIVHDTSNSGQTLFIEPQPLVDLGNRLKISEAAVHEEEHRILARLTQRLVDHCAQVRSDLGAAAILDSYIARARLANDLQAEVPKIEKRAVLQLSKARHPSLVLAQLAADFAGEKSVSPVGNDICIEQDSLALIISGPNAGGKTVALKTAGLCALMLRAGLPIPAMASSRLSIFDNIFAVIGDDQSIDQNLSTFSAHILSLDATVQRVQQIQAEKKRPTLCLVDELAQGTDPSQGASLGQAFLEALSDLGTLTIATTHFERLKALALDDSRFRNASVALDPETLRPTFQLHPDVPGASSAFAIADGLGVQPQIVQRARELAGPQANRLEAYLSQMAEERDKLSLARAQLEQEVAQTQAAKEKLQASQQRLSIREKELRQEARTSLLGDVRRARNQVAEIIASLQSGQRPTLKKADQAAHRLLELEQRVQKRLDQPAPSREAVTQVQVGQWVHVANLGQDGQVQEVDGKSCVVLCGALRTRVRCKDLKQPLVSRSQQRKKGRQQRAAHQQKSSSNSNSSGGSVENPGAKTPRTSHNTLDLRGQRVEEAMVEVDKFFDQMMRQSTLRVFLLHGHGTGALKKGLRKELLSNPYVVKVAPAPEDEGGEAFTVVEIG